MTRPLLEQTPHPSVPGLWAWVAERENIRRRRAAGLPEPWTEDPTLAAYHFCNIRRADDAGTRWYLGHAAAAALAGANADWLWRDLLWRTMLYRIVNSVDYFQQVFPHGLPGILHWRMNRHELEERIWLGPVPSSPAYLILARPEKTARKAKLISALGQNSRILGHTALELRAAPDLAAAHKLLQDFSGVGPFIAMQIYRDLILTGQVAWDDDSFCYLGPGTRSGLAEIFGPGGYRTHYAFLISLRDTQEEYYGDERLSLGDVEHVVCEYRKWLGFRAGRGKRRLRRGRDLAQPGGSGGPEVREREELAPAG